MSPARRNEIRMVMAYYDFHGWDWSLVVEFLTVRFNQET